MIELSNSVLSLVIGATWAVVLHGYGRVYTTSVFEETSFVRITAHTLLVGGGTGVVLYATHYALSAFVYGAIGYVVTGLAVWVTSNGSLYN